MAAKDYRQCQTRKDVERLFAEYCRENGMTEQEAEYINRRYRNNYAVWSTEHAAFIANAPRSEI